MKVVFFVADQAGGALIKNVYLKVYAKVARDEDWVLDTWKADLKWIDTGFVVLGVIEFPKKPDNAPDEDSANGEVFIENYPKTTATIFAARGNGLAALNLGFDNATHSSKSAPLNLIRQTALRFPSSANMASFVAWAVANNKQALLPATIRVLEVPTYLGSDATVNNLRRKQGGDYDNDLVSLINSNGAMYTSYSTQHVIGYLATDNW